MAGMPLDGEQIGKPGSHAAALAQLQKMREAGLNITYLDEHMGVGWLPGLRDALVNQTFGQFTNAPVTAGQWTAAQAVQDLEARSPLQHARLIDARAAVVSRPDIVRLSGADRYATAAAISKLTAPLGCPAAE